MDRGQIVLLDTLESAKRSYEEELNVRQSADEQRDDGFDMLCRARQ
jgi:hypothetical protein